MRYLSSAAARGADKARRFPPSWSVEECNDACFIVRGHDGRQLAYVYFDNPRAAAKPLTKDEARRIAANIAKLPELFAKRLARAAIDARPRPVVALPLLVK